MGAGKEAKTLWPVSEEHRSRLPPSSAAVDGKRLSQAKHGVRMARDEKLAVSAIAIANFSVSLAASILAPFFPQEAAAKGASDMTVGLIFGVSQLTICISSPIYGSMVSHTGPSYLSLCGLLMCAICMIFFGTLSRCPDGAPFVALCFACTIVDANGAAMLATASYSMLAVEFPKRLSLVLGILETCVGAAYLVGPLFGGFLYSVGGFALPFFVVGGLQLISLAALALLQPSVECEGKRSKICLSLLATPHAWMAFLLVFSETFALSFLEPVLGKELISIDPNISTTVIGAVFMVQCATYSVTSPVAGWLCDKGYISGLMLGGSAITILGLLVVGPSPLLPFLPREIWLVALSLGVLGLGMGMSWIPAFQTIICSALNAGHSNDLATYGAVSGLFNCGWALGAFAGPSLAGILTLPLGFRWATTACATLCLFVVIVASTLVLSGRANRRINTVRCEDRRHTVNGSKVADEGDPLLNGTESWRKDVSTII